MTHLTFICYRDCTTWKTSWCSATGHGYSSTIHPPVLLEGRDKTYKSIFGYCNSGVPGMQDGRMPTSYQARCNWSSNPLARQVWISISASQTDIRPQISSATTLRKSGSVSSISSPKWVLRWLFITLIEASLLYKATFHSLKKNPVSLGPLSTIIIWQTCLFFSLLI